MKKKFAKKKKEGEEGEEGAEGGQEGGEETEVTRMHSSRMRTTRLLTISRSARGDVCLGGVYLGGVCWVVSSWRVYHMTYPIMHLTLPVCCPYTNWEAALMQLLIIARKWNLWKLCFHRLLSVHGGGGVSAPLHACIYPSPGTRGRHPPPRHPSRTRGRPPCTVHAGIRSTNGWYASHWNAF